MVREEGLADREEGVAALDILAAEADMLTGVERLGQGDMIAVDSHLV